MNPRTNKRLSFDPGLDLDHQDSSHSFEAMETLSERPGDDDDDLETMLKRLLKPLEKKLEDLAEVPGQLDRIAFLITSSKMGSMVAPSAPSDKQAGLVPSRSFQAGGISFQNSDMLQSSKPGESKNSDGAGTRHTVALQSGGKRLRPVQATTGGGSILMRNRQQSLAPGSAPFAALQNRLAVGAAGLVHDVPDAAWQTTLSNNGSRSGSPKGSANATPRDSLSSQLSLSLPAVAGPNIIVRDAEELDFAAGASVDSETSISSFNDKSSLKTIAPPKRHSVASRQSQASKRSWPSTKSIVEDVDVEFPSLVPTACLMHSYSKITLGTLSSSSTGSTDDPILYKYAMAPDSRARLVWDFLIIANTVIAATLVPLLLIYFDRNASPHVLDYFLMCVIDMMWPIDIVMHFFTAFFVGGVNERSLHKIAVHYSRGWLVLDVLAAWPLFLTSKDSTGYVVACILKLPRLMQLAPRYLQLQSNIGAHGAGLPALIIIMCCIGMHMMACGWRLCLRADGWPLDSQSSIAERYLSDAYWASMTLTSVGYGDIVPNGNASRVFAILVMIVGSLVFGATVSACSFLMQKVVNNEGERQLGELTTFMNRRAVPKDLQRKVRHNLRQHLQYSEASVMAPALLASLSPSMQRELCLSILNDTVIQFPLFRNAQRSFVAELAMVYGWEQALPGDLLADEGQVLQEVVFLIEGCLQAWIRAGFTEVDVHINDTMDTEPDGTEIDSVVQMTKGAWFGEASLFDEEHVYTGTISALTRCELAVLPACEYVRIVHKYPGLYDRHESIRKAIISGTTSLKNLRYKNGSDNTRRRESYHGAMQGLRGLLKGFNKKKTKQGARVSVTT